MIYIEIEPINIPKPESLVLGKEDSEIELFSFIEEEKPYLKVHKLNQDEQNTKLICSINEVCYIYIYIYIYNISN